MQIVGVSNGVRGQLEFLFHLLDGRNQGTPQLVDVAETLQAFAQLFVELSSNVTHSLASIQP